MSPIPAPVPGYPRLAHEMSSIPETAVFRRFADLNHQSLLYYQAELTILERQLRQQELESSNPHTGKVKPAPNSTGTKAAGEEEATHIEYATRLEYAKNWYWLGADNPGNEQWQTVLRVRGALREYSKTTSTRPLITPSLTSPAVAVRGLSAHSSSSTTHSAFRRLVSP